MTLSRCLIYALLFTILSCLSSCSSNRGLSSFQQKIIGIWVLESMDVDGETIPAAFLGGKLMFQFGDDGIAHFTPPDGETESGQYIVQNNSILDPNAPQEEPLHILSLKEDRLILSMIDGGEKIIITLIPEEEELGFVD